MKLKASLNIRVSYLSATFLLICFCRLNHSEGRHLACQPESSELHVQLVAIAHPGAATLSPSGIATVCSGSDVVELTCTTSQSPQQWSSSLFGNTFGISRSAPSNQTSREQVNSTTFTFSRISDQYSLPLVSALVISPVTDILNGSVFHCKEITTSNQATITLNVVMNEGQLDICEAIMTTHQIFDLSPTFCLRQY